MIICVAKPLRSVVLLLMFEPSVSAAKEVIIKIAVVVGAGVWLDIFEYMFPVTILVAYNAEVHLL